MLSCRCPELWATAGAPEPPRAPATKAGQPGIPPERPRTPLPERLVPLHSRFDLSGKAAVVTGGNSGIGLGMAKALAAAGADIAVWGTNPAKNAAAVDQLTALGTKVLAVRCDVGDPEQVADAMEQTLAAFGRVDTCVANAGVGGDPARFVDLTMDQWRKVMRVNVDGAFLTMQAAARTMVEAGTGGSIVAVASIMGNVRAMPRTQPYAASKAALLGLVRSAATELGRHGIRVNAVLPGWIETPLADDALSDPAFAGQMLPRIALGRRFGTPDDLGGIAVYLASDASAYHTGDQFVVDGGYVLQ